MSPPFISRDNEWSSHPLALCRWVFPSQLKANQLQLPPPSLCLPDALQVCPLRSLSIAMARVETFYLSLRI